MACNDPRGEEEEGRALVAPSQFFSREQIEQSAFNLLREYTQIRSLAIVEPPIPIERIAEDLLDLKLLWEPIEEARGQTILAKLVPSEQRVVFNEGRQTLFDSTAGLYQTTLAHEIGHWVLHAGRGRLGRTLSLFGEEEDIYFVYRSDGHGDGSTWDERNAHRFMACLLMPRHLLVAAVAESPVTNFHTLYRLRDRFQVTVTALQLRLEQLNLIYIDADGHFYPNRQVFSGQTTLL